MPRLNPPDVEQMSEHQRRVYDAIASGPRGKVRGPLAIWLHRPGLAEHAQALGQYCRYDSSLPPRLSELAILTMAALWRAPFEWWAHHPIALKAGLDADVAEQIRAGATPCSPSATNRSSIASCANWWKRGGSRTRSTRKPSRSWARTASSTWSAWPATTP